MCSERDNTNILNLNNGISEVTLTPGASSELHHQYNKVLCNKTAFKSNHIKRSGEVIRQPERTWIRLNLWIMYDSWTWGQYYFFLNSLCLSLSFVKWKQLKYLPKCISRTKLILTAFNCSVCRYSETSIVEGGGKKKKEELETAAITASSQQHPVWIGKLRNIVNMTFQARCLRKKRYCHQDWAPCWFISYILTNFSNLFSSAA